jgi:hypothetical protein
LNVNASVISGERREVVAARAGRTDLFIDQAGDRRPMVAQDEVNMGRARVEQTNGPRSGVLADRKVTEAPAAMFPGGGKASSKPHSPSLQFSG